METSSVIHLAIVHAADGVRFATAARSSSALMRRLLDNIRPCVSDKLWPTDAERFERLADEGEHRAAVELYFSAVGQRWDDERLWVGAATDADEAFSGTMRSAAPFDRVSRSDR